MLDSLKRWFAPLKEPTTGFLPPVPDDLPENTSATYNRMLSCEDLDLPISNVAEMPTDTRWRIARDDGDVTPVVTTVSGDDLVPPPPSNPSLLYGATSYTLHRVIAKGGFGEIWEATQGVLSRLVAVKRLRQDIIDDNRERPRTIVRLERAFRQEALVAAYLEHPNILPVHDLGLDPDGHLLLATKLVRGKQWEELMEADAHLPLDQFLDAHLPILEQVARAVAFAHARKVVHRDLKPPQVMVGEFGEVLLMDWGIAMFMLDEKDLPGDLLPGLAQIAPTRSTALNPAGTVGYMAPEQTEDTTDNIGPWTDVYLLGGLLYTLLTGRAPHHGESRQKCYWDASLGVVPNPYEVAPDRPMPAPLVALALECLKPKPKDRLASANEFVRLLDDYRKGASRRREAETLVAQVRVPEPGFADYKALAHDQSLVERALSLWPDHEEARGLFEHITLHFARVALRHGDMRLARLQAERLPEYHPERAALVAEAERLEDEITNARRHLDEAFARTRASHDRADRLVTFLLEDLHKSLQSVNRLDLMGRVGREALEYFDALDEAEQTPELVSKRALASRNIGDVFRDQGNLEGAAAAFRTFSELAARLAAREPGHHAWLLLQAEACERLSGIEYLRGHLDEALRLIDDGMALVDGVPAPADPDPDDELLRVRLLHQKGIALWRRRQLDPAHGSLKDALLRLDALARAFPSRVDIAQTHASALSTLGNVHRDRGDLVQAIRSTELGLEVRTKLAAREPDNKSLQDDICWSLTNLALLREYSGDFFAALRTYDQAGLLRRRLVAEDPTNVLHRTKLTFILSSTGRNLYGLERYAEAAKVTGESCAISRAIIEADPTNTRELGSHALSLGYHGLALYHAGDPKAARGVLGEAQPLARRALAATPENGVFQNAVCQSLILEGLLARDDGEAERARACWQEAMGMLDAQAWSRSTGQGMGMHLELSLLLGREDDAREAAKALVGKRWMMPRWDTMIAALG